MKSPARRSTPLVRGRRCAGGDEPPAVTSEENVLHSRGRNGDECHGSRAESSSSTLWRAGCGCAQSSREQPRGSPDRVSSEHPGGTQDIRQCTHRTARIGRHTRREEPDDCTTSCPSHTGSRRAASLRCSPSPAPVLVLADSRSKEPNRLAVTENS